MNGPLPVLEAIKRGSEFLARKGVASPRLQVESLLAHLLRMPRMNLYLNFERLLAPAELDALRSFVQRRGLREPLQYILGSTSFCGLEISVNPAVLIPRPETELLAQRAWTFLQNSHGLPLALDLCSGSGCIALALARNAPAAQIHAADASADALALARVNAQANHLADRIQFHHGDLFAALAPGSQFDLIVSNPPYIPSARIASLDPEVREHEPLQALDGGPDGMLFYRRIALEAAPFLRPAGRLMLELDDDAAEPARAIFVQAGWCVEAIEQDHNHTPRILVARPASAPHDAAGKGSAS